MTALTHLSNTINSTNKLFIIPTNTQNTLCVLFSVFSCPNLQISSTGQVTPTKGTGYHINDTVKFLCDVGYALSGSDTLICVINDSKTGGNWDNSQPVCQSKYSKKKLWINFSLFVILISYVLSYFFFSFAFMFYHY